MLYGGRLIHNSLRDEKKLICLPWWIFLLEKPHTPSPILDTKVGSTFLEKEYVVGEGASCQRGTTLSKVLWPVPFLDPTLYSS